jgi:hypothetical protein
MAEVIELDARKPRQGCCQVVDLECAAAKDEDGKVGVNPLKPVVSTFIEMGDV